MIKEKDGQGLASISFPPPAPRLILHFTQRTSHTLFLVLDFRERVVIFEPDNSRLGVAVHRHAGTDLTDADKRGRVENVHL